MSSSQGDAKLFARVCPSQKFLSNSKIILHNLLVPAEGLSIPFKSSGVEDCVGPSLSSIYNYHLNAIMAGFPVCPQIFEAHMTRDNPYVSNLPISAPPHHSSYLATASGLPFSLLQSIDGSSDNSIQGKVAELRQELNGGGKKDKNHSAKKITLKKIVANMTMSNNDMVALFPDIVNCMQIPSLEIKKMYVPHASVQISLVDADEGGGLRCFLYLVNYARMKPDVALKALPILLEVRLPYLSFANPTLTNF
jgi:hypothetical protein